MLSGQVRSYRFPHVDLLCLPQRRAETTLLHLHQWYRRRMLIVNGYTGPFPAFPSLHRHHMLIVMLLTCAYGYTTAHQCKKCYMLLMKHETLLHGRHCLL